MRTPVDCVELPSLTNYSFAADHARQVHRGGTISSVRGGEGQVEVPAQKLAERLRVRSPDIEAAIIASVIEAFDPLPELRAELTAGAQVVVRDVVAYSITAFEAGEEWSEPMPSSFGVQAQHAARTGMPLEELLRSYSAGNTVISEFVVEEVWDLAQPELLAFGVGVQSRVSDALISGLSAEYASELERLERSPAVRLLRQVERLLADESLVEAEIDYRLDAWHIAGTITGADAKQAARLLADKLGCELLLVSRAAEVHWAWWGGQRHIEFSQLDRAAQDISGSVFMAVGEPRQGLDGFRLSHREAEVASAVMVRQLKRLTRCADVMLEGTLLREPALADLFLDTYLGQLKAHRDWSALRETLQAYFGSASSLASAAAALEVDRHTVRRRLRKVEEIIGSTVASRRAELEVALRLEGLTSATLARPAP